MVDINDYTHETTCEYKGEVYSVRDNGAVMRHVRNGKRVRKLDNVWTFGTKDKIKGYMMVSSHRVHIIVAKAFISGNEDGNKVVDHIDTNRCNNRVENLRWLTRLENVLLNEATLKRVTFLCGGDINKFIENPSCLRDLTGKNQDIMWMRTVTAEEAKLAWKRISAWSKRPIATFKMMQQSEVIKDFDEWLKVHDAKDSQSSKQIFHSENLSSSVAERNSNLEGWREIENALRDSDTEQKKEYLLDSNDRKLEELFAKEKKESLTKGAFQIGFYERMLFPICPEESQGGLDLYAKGLHIGNVIAISENGDEYTINSLGWTRDWDAIQIEFELNGHKSYRYIHIKYEEGKFLHSIGVFQAEFRFCESPNVLQTGVKIQCYFPLCPKDGNITLDEYANLLHKDAIIEKNQYTDGFVVDREIIHSAKGTHILYVGVRMPNSLKKYGEINIKIENGKIIHLIGQTFFDERSLQRKFCNMRGQEWNDEDEVFDDFC